MSELEVMNFEKNNVSENSLMNVISQKLNKLESKVSDILLPIMELLKWNTFISFL